MGTGGGGSDLTRWKSDLDVKITGSRRDRDLTNRRDERYALSPMSLTIPLFCEGRLQSTIFREGSPLVRSKTTDGMGRFNGSVAVVWAGPMLLVTWLEETEGAGRLSKKGSLGLDGEGGSKKNQAREAECWGTLIYRWALGKRLRKWKKGLID